MNKLALLACLAALTGCSGAQQRQALLNSLIGQPETEVVRVLGVPNRSFETQGHRFLAYEQRDVEIEPGFPYAGPVAYEPRYYRYGYAFPASVVEWSCETTFDVVSSRVRSWSLRGNGCT